MKSCTDLLPHLNRIEGQIKALQKAMNDDSDCQKIVQLTLATSNSFSSLKAKLIELFVQQELLTKKKLSTQQIADLKQMLKLAK